MDKGEIDLDYKHTKEKEDKLKKVRWREELIERAKNLKTPQVYSQEFIPTEDGEINMELIFIDWDGEMRKHTERI